MFSRLRGGIPPAATRRAALVAALAFLVLLAAALLLALRGCGGDPEGDGPGLPAAPDAGTFTGRVVALDGRPVEGAAISVGGGEARTDGDGRFEVAARPGARSGWVSVEGAGFLPRVRVTAAGSPVLVRLTPDDGETVSLTFGGDVMFGRRFYDPNEDGDTSDGLLRPGAGVEEHLKLLEGVRPLLENADVAAVNLESTLADDPYFDPTGRRPRRFHPGQGYLQLSDPAAAFALGEAGVDVVDLANNHQYDALDEGVKETLDVLDQAGIKWFGAGLSEENLWEPVVVSAGGQRIAFLGCTTISGASQPIPLRYVASDASGKGGAARCREEDIRSSVARARARTTPSSSWSTVATSTRVPPTNTYGGARPPPARPARR